jgi:hypothetical protein
MKYISLLTFLVFVQLHLLQGQSNNVGIGTLNPDPSAILDLSATNKGFKLPTVNSTASVINPVEGLLIFSDSDKKLYIFSNGQWSPYLNALNLIPDQVPVLGTSGYLAPSGITVSPSLGINLNSMIIKNDFKVGITDANALNFLPQTLFHVNGKSRTNELQITNGAANGLILQSDASGNGTWVNANTLTTNNLYNSDGSFTAARTITQGSNAFTIANNGTQNTTINLSSTGDFDIQDNGTSTFFVRDNGKVGINTNDPKAQVHVKDSSVVFTGLSTLPSSPGNPPISGTGTRMMWYPDKAAFRVGGVTGTKWDNANVGKYSIAMGSNTTASGLASTSMGVNSTASGDYSTAMGVALTASGDYSTAMGFSTQALGDYSTSMGYNTTAEDFSTSMGFETTASGTYSSSLGYATISSGTTSTAMGGSTKASGGYTTSMGFDNTARSYASVAMGRYNDSIATSSLTSWVDTDPLFIIGNGTSNANRNNAITILKNAQTGINTTAPMAGLHIKGIEATFDAHIRLESADNLDYGNILYDGSMKFRNFGVGDEYQWRNSVNNIRMRLYDNGDLTIQGALTQSSDRRLKKEITPINNVWNSLNGITGYTYLWQDNNRGLSLQAGVIAQEVEESLPHLVRTDEEGEMSVNYSGMIPYLLEAVKDLKKENETLRLLVEQLLEDK